MPRLLLVFALLLGTSLASATEIKPVPPQAARRIATVSVVVAPSQPDWTYKPGDPARFTIRVVADANGVPDVPVQLSWGPEMMPAQTKDVIIPAAGLEFDAGTLQQPGFLRLTATTEINGKRYKGAATAAFSPDKIVPTQTDPSDFDAFWSAIKSEVAALPLEAKLTLLPDSCTPAVNVYHVALKLPGGSWQGPAHFYGILSEPTKPGKYPAILRVPGAGVRAYKGDIDTAAKGVITLDVGIHGIPVNMTGSIYDDLLSGPLNGYWTFNLDNRDTFYYRRVIQGCLKSVEFLASRPQWNGKKLAVAGASQGGMLSIITAALDSRVTGLAATHPAFCDVTGYVHGRAGGWPHMFKDVANATPEKLRTSSYYDVVNFARRLKVPGHYMWGYNDDVCPPTTCYAAFNVITAPKELSLTLEMAHTYSEEQWNAAQKWLLAHLEVE
ncbi:acetylxylan esterase [Nibricoccus sp. IMCC34717]|uniref:acetylxylan esterase n=1 Tax=Nibricoccus sp. IMCC34717 TaxID=3034021 RepID=UPI00384B46C6